MKILVLAYKNLLRRKLRTSFTVAGIALSAWVLATLLGFNRGYEQSLNRDIEGMGFQIVVTAKGCPYEAATLMLKGGTGLRYIPGDVYGQIASADEVAQATPMLMHAEFDENKGENGGTVVFLGVDAKSYAPMKPYFRFRSGDWFSKDDAAEIVIGYEAAELEQREVGDAMLLPGCDEEFKVVGILERTGTQDDGMIFLPLETLRRLYKKDGLLTMVGLRLKTTADAAAYEEKLYALPDVQVVSMAQVRNTIVTLVKSAKIIVFAIAAIAFLISIFGVLNTVLMSVFERTGEIGILKAMGAMPFQVFSLIWAETTLLCLSGGTLGVLVTLAFARVAEHLARLFLPFAPNGALIDAGPGILAIALGAITLAGMAGGILPAARAARIRPLEALRNENA